MEKSKKKVNIKVYGKDWLFSGQSKGFPNTLDIRYEKDLKLKHKKRRKIEYNSRKPDMLS